MRLLIADDEKNIRNGLLSLPWNTIGIQKVYQAENGLEALKILEEKQIDIVISDIKMPGLSGLELAEFVQKNSLDTAVVLLTGFSEFEYAQKALRNGVLDYMLKPLRPKDILATVLKVKETLEKRRYKEKVVERYEGAANSRDYQEQISWHFRGVNEQAMEILKDVAQNFSQGVSLNSLAEKYHYSVAYLSRMIKKETGFSFSEILNSIRLAQAAELLQKDCGKISMAGEMAGFSDQKYFSQVFKKAFGVSPGEFRKQEETQLYSIIDILHLIKSEEQ
ncbi:response regulator transcription factor [Blautia sp.]|uniref:response regulator transcription factor n=1 Tax=Blautia sp. TaxID=1955243 RepID=UPI002E7A0312|nr:response regulator [Blautia sp.]MEE0810000.1 response regulator [Blautia sp.]